jgi:hypothetical protein
MERRNDRTPHSEGFKESILKKVRKFFLNKGFLIARNLSRLLFEFLRLATN